MRKIKISLHTYEGIRSDLTWSPDDVSTVFAAAGLDLEFEQGERFADDPFDDYTVEDLIARLAEKGKDAGHLVIGGTYPLFDSSVSGQLLDLSHRGVCAVYTRSDYIASRGQAAMLQSCVHEIGHMLNLSHNHNAPNLGVGVHAYQSAMDQLSHRTLDLAEVAAAWKTAADEAAGMNAHSYFYPQPRPMVCLPLALSARVRLNTLTDDNLLPWGMGRFEFGPIVETT
jgi:hypothetical protein